MPTLRVVKGLRLAPPDSADLDPEVQATLDKAGLGGAVYIQDDVVQPTVREAQVLLALFPDHFDAVDDPPQAPPPPPPPEV